MVIMRVLIVISTLCFLNALPVSTDGEDDSHYTNSFLVELHERSTAEDVAREHGFDIDDTVQGYLVLLHKDVSHRSKRSAELLINRLKSDPRVKYADQQKELIRVKREILHDKQIELPIKKILDNSIYYRVPEDRLARKDGIPRPDMDFNDPFYKDEWYCRNVGQTGGVRDVDLNVMPAWKMGYTGKGISVSILDDGIDHTHPDLRDNYDPDLSTDLNDRGDKKHDPMPDVSNEENSHGTRCAGEIVAKANNNNCGVGISYDAKIGGVRILDGRITDDLEAKALEFKRQKIDIYSASWGPKDNGKTMEGPGPATIRAIESGVREGRGGKGSFFVWASGNGGGNDDDCNADGYVSMPESLSIGAITSNGFIPYFMEQCSSTMAVVPCGGEESMKDDGGFRPKISVVTTDLHGKCTENFQGTSAAAPLAAGCIALVLGANNDLTWRDMQHIIARGCRIPSVGDKPDWVVNAAGFHRSQKFGFGVMDCSLMVQLALGWKNVPEQRTCNSTMIDVEKNVPAGGSVAVEVDMAFCQQNPKSHVEHIEHVLLYVEIDANRRGAVKIVMTSPGGTISDMLSTRKADDSSDGIRFRLFTLNPWGENIVGENKWKIEVFDTSKPENNNNVKFHRFWLETRGTSDHPNTRSTPAFQPSEAAIAEMKELELRRGKRINLKRSSNGFKKKSDAKNNKEGVEKKAKKDKFLKDTIKDISSYLEDKGFEEDHIIEILNHGMASSAKEKKLNEGVNSGLSRRHFGEEEIDDNKFVNGISKAVNNIISRRENEKKEALARREKEMKEELARKVEERREEMARKAEERKEELARKAEERKEESRTAEERKEELAKKMENRKEKLAERYIEEVVDHSDDLSYDDVERILHNVREILKDRK